MGAKSEAQRKIQRRKSRGKSRKINTEKKSKINKGFLFTLLKHFL